MFSKSLFSSFQGWGTGPRFVVFFFKKKEKSSNNQAIFLFESKLHFHNFQIPITVWRLVLVVYYYGQFIKYAPFRESLKAVQKKYNFKIFPKKQTVSNYYDIKIQDLILYIDHLE